MGYPSCLQNGWSSDGEGHYGILPGVVSLNLTKFMESHIHHFWSNSAIEPQHKCRSEHSVNRWLLKLSDPWTPMLTWSKRIHCHDFQPKLAIEPPCKCRSEQFSVCLWARIFCLSLNTKTNASKSESLDSWGQMGNQTESQRAFMRDKWKISVQRQTENDYLF